MKSLIITLLFSAIPLSAFANIQEDELTASVKLASKTLSGVNKVTAAKSPCDIPENPKVPLADQFDYKGAKCEKFLTESGDQGEWGKVVTDQIKNLPSDEVENSFYSNNIPDMDFICPNFKSFSKELKLKFWVWTFASISWEESTCNPKASAQGINCKAVGLLQLEGSSKLRRGRGSNCEVASVNDAKNNLSCGVEILHDQLLGQKSSYYKGTEATGELFWEGSYWLHLRLKEKKEEEHKKKLLTSISGKEKKPNIKTLVMRFPYCR